MGSLMHGEAGEEDSNASKELDISSIASEKEGGTVVITALRRSNMRDAKHVILGSNSKMHRTFVSGRLLSPEW